MNTTPDPAQDWLDTFARPIEILLDGVILVSVIAIVLSILLIVARSPKGPRR